MNNRSLEIDLLKGFGIFLMVFDHVGWGMLVHTYIQSFHMPLFFIVSGFLWKEGQTTKEVSLKKSKVALKPYVFFALSYYILLIIAVLCGLSDRNLILSLRAIILIPTDMDYIPFAPALWFLPCFYLSNVVYSIIRNRFGKRVWVPIVIIAIIGMSFSSISEVMLPFTIEPFAVALLFMYLGEKAKEKEDLLFQWLDKWWVVLLLFIIEAILALINGSCDMRSARYHNCFLYIINAVLGTTAWFGFFRKVATVLPNLLSKLLSYFSINSITFLCMNQFFIFFLDMMFNALAGNDNLLVTVISKFITFISTLILCGLANELLNKTALRKVIGKT